MGSCSAPTWRRKLSLLGHYGKGCLALLVRRHLPNSLEEVDGCKIASPGEELRWLLQVGIRPRHRFRLLVYRTLFHHQAKGVAFRHCHGDASKHRLEVVYTRPADSTVFMCCSSHWHFSGGHERGLVLRTCACGFHFSRIGANCAGGPLSRPRRNTSTC